MVANPVALHGGMGVQHARLHRFDLLRFGGRCLRRVALAGGQRRRSENGNRKQCRGNGLQHGRLLISSDQEVSGWMAAPVDHAASLSSWP